MHARNFYETFTHPQFSKMILLGLDFVKLKRITGRDIECVRTFDECQCKQTFKLLLLKMNANTVPLREILFDVVDVTCVVLFRNTCESKLAGQDYFYTPFVCFVGAKLERFS